MSQGFTQSLAIPLALSKGGTGAVLTLPVFNKVVVQVITATGTYTPTTGCKYAFVELWGGGGGGASSNSGTIFGSGGGAGAYSAAIVNNPTAVTITIGAGGTGQLANNGTAATAGGNTTYDSTVVVAVGGSPATAGNIAGAGGLASSGTGTVKISGGTGNQNTASAAGFYFGGGSSPRNTPNSTFNNLGQAGVANTGQGGSVGHNAIAGGAGGSGYAVVTEFLSV